MIFRGKIDGVNTGREPYASNDSNDYHQKVAGMAAVVAMSSSGICISAVSVSAQSMRCPTNSLVHASCRATHGSRVSPSEDALGNKTIRGTGSSGSY